MKILAYTHPNCKGELLTIHEALRRRKNDPDRWEGKTYYDIVRSRPMSARAAESSSFVYQNGGGGGHGRGSKGIAHELAQDALCKQPQLKFSVFKTSFVANIARADDEVHVVDPRDPGRQCFVDVMLWLSPDCPCHKVFGDRIAIEITDTHENTKKKEKLLKDLRISTLEFKIPREWHISNSQSVTTADLEFLKRKIAGFWNAEVFATHIYSLARITSPSTEVQK